MSLLEQRQSKLPPQSNSQTDTTPINGPSNPSTRPSHISFSAQPPIFGTLALSPSSSPSPRENPFERPLLSPTLTFYTAPSTPLTSPQNDDPPPNPPGSPPHPEVVLHVPPPPTPPSEAPVANQPNELDTPAIHDDAFPNVDPLHVDPFLDDDGLSSLEKIYLFSRSQATFHRVFITHSLSTFLDEITPSEAVEYVLPLLSGLAMDPEEQVKEALAAELVPIIWWFFTHCHLVEDDDASPTGWPFEAQADVTLISVQAFTPILGTLLLSPQVTVGNPARYAIVELLNRMRKADDREENSLGEGLAQNEEEDEHPARLFGRSERAVFRDEILQQVVIGIGRLDASDEDEGQEVVHREYSPELEQPVPHDLDESTSQANDSVNPYFPVIPPSWPNSSSEPQASASTHAASTDSNLTPITAAAATMGITNADADVPLHVSFGQLPVPPSPVASYQSDDQPAPFPPGWVTSASHLSPPPNFDPPVARQADPYHLETGMHETYHSEGTGDMDIENLDGEGDEQAAVGRLSSMSLMAAVTASVPLEEETQTAFVKEVERVGKDPVYWVRREASFALGALAKIVPQEVVVCSLLPVFEFLRQDQIMHVRHSALFALPAILSRLIPAQRRSLALDTVVPLSIDEAASVRLGVLEALGEVLYTFHEDREGPPEEILRLFLGREEDHRLRDEQHASLSPGGASPKQPIWGIPKSPFASHVQDLDTTSSPPPEESPLESFYKHPERPLICAFNYPAVALTLGRARWGELRELYVVLSQDPAIKIRRTLAASLGELAKIIGPDNAQKDLVPAWWDAIRCEEDGEVRLKAIECVETFVGALDAGKGREEIAEGLLEVWSEGTLKGWRERRVAVGTFVGLIGLIGNERPSVIRGLLKLALEDGVAGVREAAISVIPQIWKAFGYRRNILNEMGADIRGLSRSPAFRSRMTFIACQQVLTLPGTEARHAILADAAFWDDLSSLAYDQIIGVRISLARFAGLLHDQFTRDSHSLPPLALNNLMACLAKDSSREVRSFVANSQMSHRRPSATAYTSIRTSKRSETVSMFSRPPPPENLV